MEIIHSFKGESVQRDADDASFILKNRVGNFLMLSDKPLTRYGGFFFHKDMDMFESLNSIVPENRGRLLRTINNFHGVTRIFENKTEHFFLPLKENSLVYEIDGEDFIELVFDGREIYDNREFGRHYDIMEEGNKIIICFSMVNEELGREDYHFYAVISDFSGGLPLYQKTAKWTEEEYSFDKRRNSWPWKRSVFSAVKIRAKRLAISVSMDKQAAVVENDFVAEHAERLETELKDMNNGLEAVKTGEKEVDMAFICAQNSVRSLMTETGLAESGKFIMAGLPWFFHYWTRDAAIALGALIKMKEYGFARDVLIDLIDKIPEDGRMFNRNSSHDRAADSAGLVFMRLYELLLKLEGEGQIEKVFKDYDLIHALNKLNAAMVAIAENYSEDNLVRNEGIETWVDSRIKQDVRDGFRVEIQALQLAMYKCMGLLSRMLERESMSSYAAKREKFLKNLIRKRFWSGEILIDGIGDSTVRPNVFLAYYIYPELLSKEEWEKTFDNALNHLWVDWKVGGGLASIDRESSYYFPVDLGENSDSYHHGDVWFWINNIAALAMYRVNREKYMKYVKKIIASSTNDILWNGAIGHASEISSAENYEPMGCWAQAWSASAFVEMIKGIFDKNR